jgi:1,4-alpha-glucan branching enzyme
MRNRLAVFGLASLALVALALAGCGPSERVIVGSTGPEIVEGGAVFRYSNPDARTVHLVGDFNEWSPTADPMTDANGDGEWSLFYPLAPGRYAYKIVVDGKRWIADPTNPDHEPDGFGDLNSIVVVPAQGVGRG